MYTSYSSSQSDLPVWFPVAFVCGCCCILLIIVAIKALFCYLIYRVLSAVPPEHRKQQPGMVWLLLIPLFGLVWNFFVYPKVSQSLKSYFDSVRRTDVGDCGESLAMVYCILAACGAVVGVAGLAGFIVLIIYLVKTNDLKNQIGPPPAGGTGYPPPLTT